MVTTDWRSQAACAKHPELDWFDTDCQLEAAVTICRTCTVRDECLDYAAANRQYDGIWGGLWGRRLMLEIRGRGGQ